MARKQKRKRPQIDPFCTCPELHEKVVELVGSPEDHISFNCNTENIPHEDEYSTWIVGKFKCPNKKCNKQWSSGKVYTNIFMYADNSYIANVYNQQCRKCKCVSKPILDDSYENRVSRRIRIWLGLSVPPPIFTDKNTPHHDMDRCEGCRAGKCYAGKDLQQLTKHMSSISVSREF